MDSSYRRQVHGYWTAPLDDTDVVSSLFSSSLSFVFPLLSLLSLSSLLFSSLLFSSLFLSSLLTGAAASAVRRGGRARGAAAARGRGLCRAARGRRVARPGSLPLPRLPASPLPGPRRPSRPVRRAPVERERERGRRDEDADCGAFRAWFSVCADEPCSGLLRLACWENKTKTCFILG